jgi:hypothetical protein
MKPNQSLLPTPLGAGSSEFAGYVTRPGWLSPPRSSMNCHRIGGGFTEGTRSKLPPSHGA